LFSNLKNNAELNHKKIFEEDINSTRACMMTTIPVNFYVKCTMCAKENNLKKK